MDKEQTLRFVEGVTDILVKGMGEIIEKGEEPVPQLWFLATEDGHPALVPVLGLSKLFGPSDVMKLLRPAVKEVWTGMLRNKPALNLVAVVMVSDAWAIVPGDPEFDEIRKRGRDRTFNARPGMSEVVVAQVSFAAAELIFQYPYVRGDGGVIFSSKVTRSMSPKTGEPVTRAPNLWPL